jgi:hypothetical protein
VRAECRLDDKLRWKVVRKIADNGQHFRSGNASVTAKRIEDCLVLGQALPLNAVVTILNRRDVSPPDAAECSSIR